MRNFSTTCYLLIIISLFYQSAKAQENSTNSNKYFAHLSLKQAGVGYLRKLGDMGLGFKLGYQLPLQDERYADESSSISILKFLTYKGFTGDILFNVATTPNGSLHILSVGYSNTQSGDLIYDPGKSAGTSGSDYSEFKEEFNAYSLRYNYLLKQSKHLFINFQVGLERRNITRRYSIEGQYADQYPSNKVESDILNPLTFDFGLVYMLGN
ncbi:hypothetical protein [Chondrinema litorale]|uniref:hypothetical protein n=1 Tax=Chondrinema litorale TaxID=2994555 RepID=UPI002543718A|nr:hypothetical protein [Chondrinema litorale]UZR97870.1 hypothetical protein OQ292_29075 [Chondrinema litorale]